MRLFTLFTYLKTKESYDKWITRRVCGFRQQISKAKYPKISQNVGRKYQEASGEHCCTVYWEKTLPTSVIRRSGYVYSEKLKRPPLLSGYEISGCKMSAHGIPDMKCRCTYPDVKMSAHGIPDMKCPALPSYPDQLHPDSPKRTCAPCYPALVNITFRMITHPIRI